MACKCDESNYDCLGIQVSSNCVTWQGPPIPVLGICPGNPITFVEQQIIDQLLAILKEEDLLLEDFDFQSCPALADKLLGKNPTVAGILQALWDHQCSLRAWITGLEQQVNQPPAPPYPFQVRCTTPPGGGSSPDAILQGAINKICELTQQVSQIAPSVEAIINVKISQFLERAFRGLGNRGIIQTGTGDDISFLFTAFVPPFVPLAYYGPLSNFDAAGKGLVGTAYEGWLLLSGLNGLADARGRTLVASTRNVPGGPLDPEVDPAHPDNPDTNYISGQKFGTSYVRLTEAQMPAHTHAVNDPGHAHKSLYPSAEKFSGSKFDAANEKNSTVRDTSIAKTGITIGNAGSNQAHNNRQPSLAITGYIMRID